MFMINLLLIIVFCVLPLIRANFYQFDYHSIPRESSSKLTAVQVMVDVTNDLSYRILQQHSIANLNNFAFSPSALTSVLIALYEGVQGVSATEIYNVLKLPWNRDIVRIGYRDVHRRLRTYFFEKDNPLTGLSLSKENVTISLQYEDILKFYGYDLGADMISPVEQEDDIANTSFTTKSSIATSDMSFPIELESPTTASSTKVVTETTANTKEPFSPSRITEVITEVIDSSSLPTEVVSSTDIATTAEADTESLTTEASSFATNDNDDSKRFSAVATMSSLKSLSTIDPTTVIFPSKRLLKPLNKRKVKIEGRTKRHFPLIFDDDPFTIPFTPIQKYRNIEFLPLDYENNKFYQPKLALSTKEVRHIFYLSAHETIQASYKVYNSVLRFNYIENIRSSVLELELDTKDYCLLVMIPDYGYGLDFLLPLLNLAPTLRVIRQEMKPRWVQAIIPDFKLKGNIFLTNDLQNLGISEVFEPSKADFSPMTNESDIYVKHIEQSINVHLRTRPIDDLKRNIGPFNGPIEISVNHPFLFFIVDKELDLATMAGRVINTLNARIN